MNRPRIQPQALAALLQAAPGRVVRALDKQPDLAESWSWTAYEAGVTVGTDKGERVTVTAPSGCVDEATFVTCTCLLSPRCVHVLAVARALPLAEAVTDAAATEHEAPSAAPNATAVVALTTAQREAARRALQLGERLLAIGAEGAGHRLQAELLTGVHDARQLSLHRLGGAALTVASRLRQLQERSAEFSAEGFVNDLVHWWSVVSHLAHDDPASDLSRWIGHARRVYMPVRSLRLFGLLTEPIVSAREYAGVVTYLIDDRGQVWSMSDVRPGAPSRARAVYDQGVGVGDITLAHREVARRGVILAEGSVSADGRIGSGTATRAVSAAGARWHEAPFDALFARDLSEQLTQVAALAELEESDRRAGWNLLFLEGRFVGIDSEVWLETASGHRLRATPPTTHEALPYRANLQRLVGLSCRCVGRIDLAAPLELAVVAAEPEPAQSDRLPTAWSGRIMLGLDSLEASHASWSKDRAGVDLAQEPSWVPDPFAPLRRRLLRLAMGGVATLPSAHASAVRGECTGMERAMLKTGAMSLWALYESLHGAERDLSGRATVDRERLFRSWMHAATYLRAAETNWRAAAWARLAHSGLSPVHD